MSLCYSAATRGFYDRALNPSVPADAVDISRETHQLLLAAQARGMEIQPGPGGAPIAVALPSPSAEDFRAQLVTSAKRESARRIEAYAPIWRQLNAIRGGGPDVDWATIDDIRAASDAIEAQIASLAIDQLAAFDPADDAHWPPAERLIP